MPGITPQEALRRLTIILVAGALLMASAVAEVYVVTKGLAGGATTWFIGSIMVFQATLITLVIQHLREQSRATQSILLTSYFFVAVLAVTAIFSVLTCTPYFPGR